MADTKRFSLAQYLKDSYTELRKVTWPTRQQATQSTLIVITLSVLCAVFLGLVDFGFNAGLSYLISLKVS